MAFSVKYTRTIFEEGRAEEMGEEERGRGRGSYSVYQSGRLTIWKISVHPIKYQWTISGGKLFGGFQWR